MENQDYLPLELLLKIKSAQKDRFPFLHINYFDKYNDLVSILKKDIYPNIPLGLTAKSKPTNGIAGIYTSHDAAHFDDVVRFAGELLQIDTESEETLRKFNKLTNYEIFLLLASIRIHDIGNIDGREDHEKNCFSILRELPLSDTDWSDNAEKKDIANIAQAHGGELPDERGKDVISVLPNQRKGTGKYGGFRPQLLASILRFADEICELSNRAAFYFYKNNSLPKHNEIFHAYAKSIASVNISEKPLGINIEYQIECEAYIKKWGCTPKNGITEKYLLEEIIYRLSKMDLERKYCNIYSREVYAVNDISAAINIIDKQHENIQSISVKLTDKGYPVSEEENLKKNINIEKYLSKDFFDLLSSRMEGQ